MTTNQTIASPARLARFVLACGCVLALCGLVAAAAGAHGVPPAPTTDPLDPRTYAPQSRLFLEVHATGVQRYACQANGTWLFTDPDATLFRSDRPGKAVGAHFLNFATGRPVWRFKDGSTVEAARTAAADGGAGNVAWLLLEAVATADGPDGDRLTETTWVQRLNTSGGVAPAGACTPGDARAVPYTADYSFWRAKATHQDED